MAVEKGKKILGIAAAAILAYGAYKVLIYKKNPATAVKQIVEKPIETAAKIVDEGVKGAIKKTKSGLKYFAKGSPEAKAHMAKLRSKRKKKAKK